VILALVMRPPLLQRDHTSVGHWTDCLHTALAQDNFAIAVDDDDNQKALRLDCQSLVSARELVFVPAPDVE
jgi:hypothetical protein